MAKKVTKLSVESFEQSSIFKPWTRKLTIDDSFKEPGYDYRIVVDSPDSISFRAEQGWEPCVIKAGSNGQPDEYHRPVAGMIALRRPKEITAMHKQALQNRSLRRMRGPIDSFSEEARRRGVSAIDTSKFYRGSLAAGLNEPDDNDE